MEPKIKITKTPSRKSKRLLGMTASQIAILSILGCLALVLLGVLASLILSNTNFPSDNQPIAPTPKPTKIPPTSTSRPNNQVSGCNKVDVDAWVDQTVPRLNAIDSDIEFMNVYPPSSYDGYTPYAESAKQKYYEQLSQKTPVCLANVQELALEELRLFWKGLEAASNGDRNALNDYFSRLVEISRQVDQAIQEFEPTPTPVPSSSLTPIPIKITLSGGDIGRGWSNDNHRIGLLSVYRTEALDGAKPFGEWNGGYKAGFTQFLVVELQFDRFTPGFEDYEMSGFHLWAYTDDGYREYQADQYLYRSLNMIRVNYQETVREFIAFEVMPESHNFIMCYHSGIAVAPSGKIVNECGSTGYQFKFGD